MAAMLRGLRAPAASTEPLYDSAARLGPRALLRSVAAHRELVGLLARREVTARYRRALLGMAWTVITPVAYAAALWAVFSQVAPFVTPGLPYIVYVLAGVVVLNFVMHAVIATAGEIASSAVAMRPAYVPVGVFVAAHALAAMATLAITTLVLFAVQIATDTGIPTSALGLPVAFALLAIATAGAGAFVGALAVLFTDALEMTRVVLSLGALLTPVFYPLTIVPDRYEFIIELNPIHQYLLLVRDLAYGGGWPDPGNVAICVVIAAAAAAAGMLALARVRRMIPSLV
jgi:ABC-type polysaccharide/polyol phosphate export permease